MDTCNYGTYQEAFTDVEACWSCVLYQWLLYNVAHLGPWYYSTVKWACKTYLSVSFSHLAISSGIFLIYVEIHGPNSAAKVNPSIWTGDEVVNNF